jgi:hypothetical protein
LRLNFSLSSELQAITFLKDDTPIAGEQAILPGSGTPQPPESAYKISTPSSTISIPQPVPTMLDRAIIDSGCSRHAIGKNSLHLVTHRSPISLLKLQLTNGCVHTANEEVTILASIQTKNRPTAIKMKNVVY